jgi:predicted transcriptional regulator
MEVVWSAPPEGIPVGEIRAYFPDHAYTTVMTILVRLERKNLVGEHRNGRQKFYTALTSKAEFIAALMQDALDLASDRTAALVQFARSVDAEGAATLREALGLPIR